MTCKLAPTPPTCGPDAAAMSVTSTKRAIVVCQHSSTVFAPHKYHLRRAQQTGAAIARHVVLP